MTCKLFIFVSSWFMITTLSFSSPHPMIKSSSENKQNPSYAENHFASLNSHIPGYLDKYIVMKSQIPKAQEDSKVLFIETSNDSILPKSPDSNIIVLSNNKNLRYHYSNILINPAIVSNAAQAIPKNVPLGDFLSSSQRYFLFSISKDHVFYNPMNYAPEQDITQNIVTLSSVLLESGIYSKFIRTNKPIRLLYRSYFDIDVYAFEQSLKNSYKSLPSKIEITITDMQNHQIVYHILNSFDTIQQNILDGKWSAENLYRKYNTIQMIRSAHWTNIHRTDLYNISIRVVGSSNIIDELQFNLSFY